MFAKRINISGCKFCRFLSTFKDIGYSIPESNKWDKNNKGTPDKYSRKRRLASILSHHSTYGPAYGGSKRLTILQITIKPFRLPVGSRKDFIRVTRYFPCASPWVRYNKASPIRHAQCPKFANSGVYRFTISIDTFGAFGRSMVESPSDSSPRLVGKVRSSHHVAVKLANALFQRGRTRQFVSSRTLSLNRETVFDANWIVSFFSLKKLKLRNLRFQCRSTALLSRFAFSFSFPSTKLVTNFKTRFLTRLFPRRCYSHQHSSQIVVPIWSILFLSRPTEYSPTANSDYPCLKSSSCTLARAFASSGLSTLSWTIK